MKKNYDQEFLDEMRLNPANWRGLFYFNRKDPRILVPKLNPGLGWTFNFANPWTYLSIGIIVIAVVITSIFLK